MALIIDGAARRQKTTNQSVRFFMNRPKDEFESPFSLAAVDANNALHLPSSFAFDGTPISEPRRRKIDCQVNFHDQRMNELNSAPVQPAERTGCRQPHTRLLFEHIMHCHIC
jgi:hypothetical protein